MNAQRVLITVLLYALYAGLREWLLQLRQRDRFIGIKPPTAAWVLEKLLTRSGSAFRPAPSLPPAD
jgi:hypothetical protein